MPICRLSAYVYHIPGQNEESVCKKREDDSAPLLPWSGTLLSLGLEACKRHCAHQTEMLKALRSALSERAEAE